MRIYKNKTVFEESLDRIRWLFDEFENVVVCDSGGKDSTVIFHLCLMVAKEKNRLPLRVMWLDQEAEWQATVDQIRLHMYDPDVEPYWYQMPFRLFNATSSKDHWLQCWDPEAEALWVHPKDPVSIRENTFGSDRFAKLFVKIPTGQWPGQKTVMVGGVRAEESPVRWTGLTYAETYKGETWGNAKGAKEGVFSMYPIYDWSYTDIWKAILDNGWPYCSLYDAMYARGTPIQKMRVSNVHHETAVHSLFFLPEVEPETWNRLTARLEGIDMANKMGKANYVPTVLPFMFRSWPEYRDYLVDKLIDNPDWKQRFAKWWVLLDAKNKACGSAVLPEAILVGAEVRAILLNDWEGVTLHNLRSTLSKRAKLVKLGELV